MYKELICYIGIDDYYDDDSDNDYFDYHNDDDNDNDIDHCMHNDNIEGEGGGIGRRI